MLYYILSYVYDYIYSALTGGVSITQSYYSIKKHNTDGRSLQHTVTGLLSVTFGIYEKYC